MKFSLVLIVLILTLNFASAQTPVNYDSVQVFYDFEADLYADKSGNDWTSKDTLQAGGTGVQLVDDVERGSVAEFTLESSLVIPGHLGWKGSVERTYTAWVKTTAKNNCIISSGSKGSGTKFLMAIDSDEGLRFEVDGGYAKTDPVTVADDTWHYIAMVWKDADNNGDGNINAKDIMFYLDGVHVPTTTSSGQIVNTVQGYETGIGLDIQNTGRHFRGRMDNVRLINKALTFAEVYAFYTGLELTLEPYAEWLFDDANDLTKATTGIDLVLEGTHEAIEGPMPDNGAVRIGLGSHYRFTHGITPEAGETYVNEYSVLFDIRVPDVSNWRTFFQANGANTDDGELFVRNNGGTIGVADIGYSSKAIQPDKWYRVIMVINNGSECSLYLDKEKILTGNVQSIDGRFGLRPDILLFGDNDGDDYSIDVARVNFYDYALSSAEVQATGLIELPPDPFMTKPYLQNAKTTGITVMWESDVADAGTLYYGKTTDYGSQQASSTVTTNANTYIHKVVLTNLDAGTQYYYEVDLNGISSQPQSFYTAPDDDNATFSVGLWGDSHYANPWSKMAEYMIDVIQPDFAFNSGDISNSGNNRNDIEKVFLPYVCGTIGAHIPFYSAMGNHDVGSQWGGGNLIRQFHDQPEDVNSDPNGFNGSYLKMYANVAFIAIDWNRMETDVLPDVWLETVLKSQNVQNARFRFVFIHNAPYYERWQVAEKDVLKNNIPALCEEYDVDVIFSGHMHGYERGYKNDVMYITMGGGSYLDSGEPVGPIIYDHIIRGTNKPENPADFYNGLRNHILSLHVDGNNTMIKLHYFNSNGTYNKVIETVELSNIPSSVGKADDSAKVKVINDKQFDFVKIKSETPFMVELYDISGKCVYSDKKPSTHKDFNTSSFSSGIFIVKVFDVNGKTYTTKIHLN